VIALLSTPFGESFGRRALEPVTGARESWLRLASGEYGVAELSAHPSPGQRAVVRGVWHSLMLPADIVRHVMAGQQPPPETPKDDVPPPPDSGAGMTAISYLVGGMLVWGGAGWLVDRYWLHTDGIAVGIGCVLGAAAGVYLIARRLGA
jgi:ATP synthase protein I